MEDQIMTTPQAAKWIKAAMRDCIINNSGAWDPEEMAVTIEDMADELSILYNLKSKKVKIFECPMSACDFHVVAWPEV